MKKYLLHILLLTYYITVAQIPTNGLIGYYDFSNASPNDLTIHANHFSTTGITHSATSDRFGNSSEAMNLSSDNFSRSNIGYPSGSNNDNELGSISFWIKTNTNDTNTRTILDDTNGRSDVSDNTWGGYYLFLKEGKIGMAARVQYSTGIYEATSITAPTAISDGQWHHIVVTLRNNIYFTGASDIVSTYIQMYVDGTSVGTRSFSESRSFYAGGLSFSQSLDSQGNVVLGNNRNLTLTTLQQYQDEIDDLIFYSRILSTTEIDQLGTYNGFCFANASDITISNITETDIDVSIPSTSTYDLAYHKKNEDFSNAVVLTNISSGAQTLTNLAPSTPYYLFIREHCTSTITSNWTSLPVEFRTQGPIYVDQDATGTNDGSSWQNAYQDLQTALNIDQDGDVIWIAEGVYNPGNDRLDVFTFNRDNTQVFGGFNGTETDIHQRDLQNHKTILSADVNQDDTGVDFTGVNRTDNNYRVAEVGAQTILIDGILFEDGHANNTSSSSAYAYGAGLLISSISTQVSIKNCEFNNNVTYSGGALRSYMNVNTDLYIDNCKFNNNVGRYAAGMYILLANNRTSQVYISNSLFSNNTSKDYTATNQGYTGSAAWIRANGFYSSLSSKIVNCTFVNNIDTGNRTDSENGCLALGRNSSSTHNSEISNSIFWNNTGVLFGTPSINYGHTVSPNTVIVRNSIGQDNFTNITNTSNISNSNPQFTDATNNDFTLQSTSPAIDSGDNTLVLSHMNTDLLGTQRIHNAAVDMGVYEFGSITLTNPFLNTQKDYLYPNPATDFIFIDTEIKEIEIFDLTGKRILISDQQKTNITEISNGHYIVKITTYDHQISYHKLIKL